MEVIRPISSQPIPTNAQLVFQGKLFEVFQWQQKMFDGTTATFEKVRRPDTVVVFPVLDDGKIVLTEQEQPGVGKFLGAIGGRVDHGEEILAAAQRELREESGFQAEQFTLWDAQQPTPKIDWAVFTFVAKGITKIAEPQLDAGEKIILKPVTLDEFLELGTNERFSEKEIVAKLFEAKLDHQKKVLLQKLFATLPRQR